MKLLIISILSLMSFHAYSQEWNVSGKVTSIYLKPSRNGVYLTHDSMITGGCGTSVAFYFLDASSTLFKETYSLLLAAYNSEKPVKILLDGCQPSYQYPLITEVISE